MNFLYQLSMFLYGAMLHLASPFIPKAKLWVQGRKNWRTNHASALNDMKNSIWLHAASLGEFEQGRPVLEALREKYPDRPIVLTFFSPSGYEVRKNWPGADAVLYLPLDTKKNARDFVSMVRPSVAIFVKYEFWMNTLSELKRQQVSTVLISGIFRSNHLFLKPYGKWFRQQMSAFSMTFMQNEESVNWAKKIDLPAALSGDTRFDRVMEIAENADSVQEVREFCSGQPTIVVGSSWGPEERVLSEFVQRNQKVKVVLVPHEIGETHLSQ